MPFTYNSNSHVRSQSPPLNAICLSSMMDTDGSSPVTDLNPSLEASLDPAQWLNAGTPESYCSSVHRTRVTKNRMLRTTESCSTATIIQPRLLLHTTEGNFHM